MLTFNSAALSSLVLAGVEAGVGATLGLVSADGVDACNVAAGFNGADACFSGFFSLEDPSGFGNPKNCHKFAIHFHAHRSRSSRNPDISVFAEVLGVLVVVGCAGVC